MAVHAGTGIDAIQLAAALRLRTEYELAGLRRERFCPGIEVVKQLDSGHIENLLAFSRPRNHEGASLSFFDDFPGRESESARSKFERLRELQLMRIGGSSYLLTERGYTVADGLWRIAILRAVASREGGLKTADLAPLVKLTDGEAEQQELERHLSELSNQQVISVETQDSAELLQPTGAAQQVLKSFESLVFEIKE